MQGINKYGRIAGGARQPTLGPGPYAFVWQQQDITRSGRTLANFLERFQMLAGGARARAVMGEAELQQTLRRKRPL